MVRAFAAFLDFCYFVRRDVIDDDTLSKIQDALNRFHQERVIFEQVGVRAPDDFSLPRQHSLKHYQYLIKQFGAPNGLCSSITESKHIKAVKQPWRRSSRYKALGQMLTTNSRVDKLAAARVDFDARNMLDTPAVPATAQDPSTSREDDEEEDAVEGSVDAEVVLAKSPSEFIIPSVRKVPRDVEGLATYLNVPRFAEHIRRFLYEQLHPNSDPMAVNIDDLPPILSKIFVYPSATAIFRAPSDHSGIRGMRRERI